MVKNLPTVQETHSVPESGRFPEERNGYPLQYSCPEFHEQKRLAGYSLSTQRVGHS